MQEQIDDHLLDGHAVRQRTPGQFLPQQVIHIPPKARVLSLQARLNTSIFGQCPEISDQRGLRIALEEIVEGMQMRPHLPPVAQTGLRGKILYPAKVQVVRAIFKMPRLMGRHEFIQT